MTTAEKTPESPDKPALDFIRQIVADDLASGKHACIVTRFPPEPNGYLHVGHAKSITTNFGIAQEVGEGRFTGPGAPGQGDTPRGAPIQGRCHLRFDDTNPVKEEQEYIDAIKRDLRWLGFDWGEHEYYASDYFQQLYDWAVLLINTGKAFVCDLTMEQVREHRGTLTAPGTNSPFRDRPAAESLDLFARMKAGEFPDGSRTLRAKIDMASPNLNLRDPVMYRILHAAHPRTGDAWCIYPMYDWAHGQSDWIEGVTHSLCTLEFEAHRPLYDWFVSAITEAGGSPTGVGYPPRQIEFARLNLTHTVMSKRRFLALVDEGHVAGWDDPRMPTLSGMRRRGYTPTALRNFCRDVGNSKRAQTMALSRLEHAVREDLNKTAPRVMAVLDPVKVVITNWPEGQTEEMSAVNNPEDPSAGHRPVPFSGELYIERADFMIDPPRKFFRLGPGREVRLRYAYWVTCTDYKTDDAGNVTEIHCTYDPATKGGESPPPDAEGKVRKVKGTLHWVSAQHAVDAEVRLYGTLFAKENPADVEEGGDWRANLNPESLQTLIGCKAELSLTDAKPGDQFQFERQGYFCVDPDSEAGSLVFNRTVSLKDSWGKMQKK